MVGDILQPTHLLFVLVVALLVLGPKRLPEVGKTLGSGLRDFKDALSGESSHSHERVERPEPEWVHAPADPPPAEESITLSPPDSEPTSAGSTGTQAESATRTEPSA